MERYISELAIALKEYQTKEKITDQIMSLVLNELVAMKIRETFKATVLDGKSTRQ